MKIKESFELKLKGNVYLVTHDDGERKSILFALNDTGAFLWNGLKGGLSEDELHKRLCEEYEAEPDEVEMIRGDVKDFLDQLRSVGALEEA